jgi:AAA domain
MKRNVSPEDMLARLGVEQLPPAANRNKAERSERDAPPPGYDVHLPPPPNLDKLTAKAWAAKQLPPRDFLMGTALSTTSRWMIIGDTGVGKTLFGMAMAMGVAGNCKVLNWEPGDRQRRVMYIDGDLPAETFQERIKLALALYGAAGVEFYGYNLDELDRNNQSFEPFNTPEGRAWLEREIERVQPDLIIFDSVMCLTLNAMADDRAWQPVSELIGWLTSRRIAQIWIHHTGHDPNRGFGTKSREWRLDTVILLTLANDDGLSAEEGAPVEMRFKKARLRTPQNRDQFLDLKIAFGLDGWRVVEPLSNGKRTTKKFTLMHAICDAYDRLADAVEPEGDINGYKVLKVKVAKLRDELRTTGYLDEDDNGHVTGAERQAFATTKKALLNDGFKERDGYIWRTKPSRRSAR